MIRASVVHMQPGSWRGGMTVDRKLAPWGQLWAQTSSKLLSEAERLDADEVVIELAGDVQIRRDGLPSARSKVAAPVIVHLIGTVHGDLRWQSDRWSEWVENVHAVALTLERLRLIDRYGCVGSGEQYRGWAALPAEASGGPAGFSTAEGAAEWLAKVVECPAAMVLREPRVAVRAARARLHPDREAGSHAAFLEVQRAADLLGVS